MKKAGAGSASRRIRNALQSRWSPSAAAVADARPVEEVYKALSMKDHVLLRPEMYIGSRYPESTRLWVEDACTEVTVVPGLAKIFDEILVNVADNFTRTRTTKRPTTTLNVIIENDKIEVYNDGKGVDVQWHNEMEAYCPEVVFGHFRAGSNFNDNDGVRITGGRNGVGAKATNVLSKKFTVEIGDSVQKKRYTQTWSDSMAHIDFPKIENKYKGCDYTRITFTPLLSYFNLTEIDSDHMTLFTSRLCDIAACCDGLTVSLNGTVIPINSFQDFVKQKYTQMNRDIVFTKFNDNKHNLPWEIAVGVKNYETISFVNGINTNYGGSHVTLLLDKIIDVLQNKLFGSHKVATQRSIIKEQITLFAKCQISSPEFSSQTKGKMTYPRTQDISIDLPQSFKDELCTDNDITAGIKEAWRTRMSRNDKKMAKQRAKRLTIRKLEDAKYAGTSHSMQCSLVLTEGDSAKSLAMAGLSEVTRDFWGILPLRGKVLNVSKNSAAKLEKNDVFTNLIKALGLEEDKTYETDEERSNLRYGAVVIMCDQDHDGSHIKGLIVNLFKTYWPALLRHWSFDRKSNLGMTSEDRELLSTLTKEGCKRHESSFIKQLVTPVIKAFPKNQENDEKWFFNQNQFDTWEAETIQERSEKNPNYNLLSDYQIKYYKGLGTSSSKEGKQYFRQLYQKQSPLLVDFLNMSGEDESSISLAFGDNVYNRKLWLEGEKRIEEREGYGESVSLQSLMFDEVYEYFHHSNSRGILSVIDGLKPSQRKVMHTCFTNKLTKEIKVTQLGGLVLKSTSYHHGETSLFDTIVRMGQNYTGSGNNIPLLMGRGQFGTRLTGGSDYAGPRYISVVPSPLVRLVFPEADDNILEAQYDEGRRIEPAHYIPIFPMCLVNGGSGIGTGYSTKLPSYDPLVVVSVILNIISTKKGIKKAFGEHKRRKELLVQYRKAAASHAFQVRQAIDEATDVETLRAKVELEEKAKPVKASSGGKKKKKTSKPSTNGKLSKMISSIKNKIEAEHGQSSTEMKEIEQEIESLELSLVPWYDNHKSPNCPGFISEGCTHSKGNSQYITELPIGEWTETFKSKLDALLDKRLIRKYKNSSSDSEINFEIVHYGNEKMRKTAQQVLSKALAKPIPQLLYLTSPTGVREMTVEEMIFDEFLTMRLNLYEKRIKKQQLQREAQIAQKERLLAVIKLIRKHSPHTEKGMELIEEQLSLQGYHNFDFSNQKMSTFSEQSRTLTIRSLEKLKLPVNDTPTKLWKNELIEFANQYVALNGLSKKDITTRLRSKKHHLLKGCLIEKIEDNIVTNNVV